MLNRIKGYFDKIKVAIDKYRLWSWPVAIVGFAITISWGPNTSTIYPAFPFIVGLVALFFATHGEVVFSELSTGEYFIAASMGMIWSCYYGMVFLVIMVVLFLLFGI